MKKVTLQIMASVFVIMSIVLASCSKEGPAGPAGAQGPAGPTGAQGPAGAKGDPGTANVIYSNWIDTAKWLPDTVHVGGNVDTVSYTAVINAPKLDLSILNSGDIKVFVDFNLDKNDP
ncbi:MAG: collagen-like protein, partial [Chitinophagaceae bacterium]|nr:collagen-like protein [Chitinophagaceae bacterium]